MPKVFVTQERSTFDYSPAESYGELVFLTSRDVSPIKDSLVNQSIWLEIGNKLIGFSPGTDFVLPSGSPIITGIAFFIVGLKFQAEMKSVGELKVLRWSSRDSRYQTIQLPTTPRLEDI